MAPCFFTFAAVESWKFGKKSAEISMDNLLAKAGWQRCFVWCLGVPQILSSFSNLFVMTC